MSQQTSAIRKWFQRLKRRITPLYYEIVYGLCTPAHVSCMNFGYAPANALSLQGPSGAGEALQRELYRQAFSQLPAPLRPDQLLCEVSCGRGGGLAFLKGLTAARVLGLERSCFARRYAKALGLDVRAATAPNLPLADASVDAFLSVEAAHNYHSDAFVAELARCLKPGGLVLLADMNLGSDTHVRASISARYARQGLSVLLWRDIRPNVLEALRQDEARKRAFLRPLPAPLRPEAAAYMGLVGTHKYLEMQRDERAYFLMLAQKATDATAA